MAKIIKQFTKVIFPFSFEPADIRIQDAVYENKKGKKFQKFLPFSLRGEYLRDGLDQLLSEEGGTAKIADCYKLNIDCRSALGLPSQKGGNLQFFTRSNPQPYSVTLQEICLYLFESNVGFLEFEFRCNTERLEDYSQIAYFLCEAKARENYFSYTQTTGKAPDGTLLTAEHEYSMSDLIEEINRTVCGGEEKLRFSYKKEKPLIYAHLLTDKKPDDLVNLIYHLNKNYKDSYKFDPDCLGVKSIHPFENYYWTASLNGATNLSYQTADETTNLFFEDGFFEKALTSYYYLFLNVLHQRYAVSRIMADMGKLDCLVHNYQIMQDQFEEARICEERAVNLKFRAFFNNPSTVDHINAYYAMLGDAFATESLFGAFSSDITNLQNICNRYVTRIKARDEKLKQKKEAKIEILALFFGVIVAELSIFKTSWDIIEKVLGRTLTFWSTGIILLAITLATPLVTMVINVVKQAKKIRALQEELDDETYRDLVEDDAARIKDTRKARRLRRKQEKKKK